MFLDNHSVKRLSQSQSNSLSVQQMLELIQQQLADSKAENIQTIDIQGRSSVADYIVIASGNSGRHLKSMSEHLVAQLKQHELPPLGVEGEREGEWVLVDAGDVIVHLMLPKVRDFYNLEKLWDVARLREASNQA